MTYWSALLIQINVLMRTVLEKSVTNRGIMSGGGQTQSSSTVRHVACSLLYCCEGETPTEGRIRKQILVSSNVSMLYTP